MNTYTFHFYHVARALEHVVSIRAAQEDHARRAAHAEVADLLKKGRLMAGDWRLGITVMEPTQAEERA